MKAEAKLKTKHRYFFAIDEKNNMYAAIDEIVNKLDIQLKREKEKIINNRRLEEQKNLTKSTNKKFHTSLKMKISEILSQKNIL